MAEYTTRKKTREGFYTISGIVATPGPLMRVEDTKVTWTWADDITLSDQESMDTLLGKAITIDHHAMIVDPESIYQSAGNVYKVWWDADKQEQRFTALITNLGLIKILDDNPKMKIGVSPTYWCDYPKIGDKITQRKRYYNNLTLTFITEPKNSKALVFTDSLKGHKMNNKDVISALTQLVSSLSEEPDSANSVGGTAGTADPNLYEKGFADGAKYNNTLAMADSLGIVIKPETTLDDAIFAVANHLAGGKLEAGKPVDFYDGIISARSVNGAINSDSVTVNPDQTNKTLSDLQAEARKRLHEQRYPTTTK